LCRSFLAVRAETDISLAKYARLPSVTLLTKNPRNEFLLPFEVIITVAFCQYDNTIDWSYHHHPLRRLGADRVRGGDRLARLGANRQLLQGCIDQLAPNRQFGCGRSRQRQWASIVEAGSFPRSFLIPGTDISIRIGG
jgi:hypothetical protein